MKTRTIISMVLAMFVVVAGQTLNLTKYADTEQTITNVRIASASIVPDKWEKETNWRRIERMVREAAAVGGANVVVTPEGALDGYVINEVNAVINPEQKSKIIERFLLLGEPLNGPFIQKASGLADELSIFLVLCFLQRDGDNLYNSAALFDQDGDIIGLYSKTHFAQGYAINPQCYQPGDNYPVFDTPFGKVGMLICYDRQLPEPARILALKGAQVLFLPSYGSYTPPDGWNSVLLRTRAFENRLPLVFSHPFQSLLISRSGEIKSAGIGGSVVYCDINTAPSQYDGRFRNRRPETYNTLIE